MHAGSKMAAAGAVALTILGDVQPASAQSWLPLCGEGETCSFLGTRPVRYGADGSYHHGVGTRAIGCNSELFGDPAPGVEKTCEGFFTAEESAMFTANAAKDERIQALEEEAVAMRAELDEAEAEIQDLRRALRGGERRDRGGVRLEFEPRNRDAR